MSLSRFGINSKIARLEGQVLTNPIYVLVLASTLVLLSALFVPFQAELADYLNDANYLAAGKLLPASHFTPVGYPLLLAPFVVMCGINGIVAFQSLVYVATLWLAWRGLKSRNVGLVGKNETAILVALAAIAFHPYMLLNTHRVTDNAIDVFFFVALAIWCDRYFLLDSYHRAVIMGALVGIFSALRPNAFTLLALPALGLAITREAANRPPGSLAQAAARYSIFVGTAFIAFGALGFGGTGTPFFWPLTGPYNFFAGNNPQTLHYLIREFNGEPSIYPALLARGVAPGIDTHTFDPKLYMSFAMEFIRSHPAYFVLLLFAKFVLFFAPKIVHGKNLVEAALQMILALPFIIWIIAVRRNTSLFGWQRALCSIVFMLLYVLPFVVTNSDPRYRMPLDIWFIMDIAFMVQMAARRRISRSPAAIDAR